MSLNDLSESQIRQVLELLNRSHPSLVHAALSQVLEQASIMTVPISNTEPLDDNQDDPEELPPPPLLGQLHRKTSCGDMQPRPVTHESTRRL